MKIKFLGHSSFLFVADDGTSVLSDPYKPGAYSGGLTYAPIREEADMVFMTHDHEDHADISSLPNQPLQIRTGCSARGIDFDTVDTFHDNEQGKSRGPNKMVLFMIDGIRFCHAGDLGHVLTEEHLKEINGVDILMLPVGGHFTIGPREATEVMRQIDPKICIPMHFKNEKCGFPIEPVDTFLQDKSPLRRSSSSEVMITKDDLPASCSILYLPPAN